MLYHYFNEKVLGNVGDYFVVQGAKFLTCSIDENFLVGEPWLWDNCENTVKCDWLRENQSKFRIAIGIGASLTLGYPDLLYKDKTLKECEKIVFLKLFVLYSFLLNTILLQTISGCFIPAGINFTISLNIFANEAPGLIARLAI